MDRPAPSRLLVYGAFAVVYVVWGSTYLAIRVAVETLPPLLMAGTRFLCAGTLLHAWARWSGAAAPSRQAWRSAALLGVLFLFVGNGGLVWAETRVPSGLAAVLVATVPLWTVLIERLRGAPAPRPLVIAGLLAGLGGVGLLVLPAGSGSAVDPVGALVLFGASVVWSYGIVISRGLPLPESGAMNASIQMLSGGVLLLLAGTLGGEWASLAPHAVSGRSVVGLAYLVIFGSLLAFSAFTWLLRVAPPSRVATYAYVNPVVAVILGWAMAGESFGSRELAASAVIISGVVLIVSRRRR